MLIFLFACDQECEGVGCETAYSAAQISVLYGEEREQTSETVEITQASFSLSGTAAERSNWSYTFLDEALVLGIPALGNIFRYSEQEDLRLSFDTPIISGTSETLFGASLAKTQGYLVIGAPRMSLSPLRQHGALYIYSLSQTESPELIIHGIYNNEQLGERLFSCADLDRDGFSDWIAGASQSGGSQNDTTSPVLSGRIYIGLSSSWMGLSSPQNSSFMPYVNGLHTGARFGYSVDCQSDITGDIQADIVVGAPFADSEAFDASGAIYILRSPTYSLEDSISLYGVSQNAWLGWSVATGDIDGDKDIDIIAGAPGFNNGEGAIFIWLGSELESNNTQPTFSISGQSSTLGEAVDFADINGDGLSDIVLGDPNHNPTGGLGSYNAGAVYIFMGRVDFSTHYTSSISVEEADYKISSQTAYSRLGQQISHDDINRDGKMDLLFLLRNKN
ncbi:MAG: hypothetical protein VX278_12245 [Myxococcota bacterium]|nr:hypothetical protein [Myxococcota bacterium]